MFKSFELNVDMCDQEMYFLNNNPCHASLIDAHHGGVFLCLHKIELFKNRY